mmetsp:Transcript_76695/g.237525  ORF Transcript_76695/g.237525 Transcript_76695/m.237525 type:complete len:153 (+) Transcript_76695:674-1132(+)
MTSPPVSATETPTRVTRGPPCRAPSSLPPFLHLFPSFPGKKELGDLLNIGRKKNWTALCLPTGLECTFLGLARQPLPEEPLSGFVAEASLGSKTGPGLELDPHVMGFDVARAHVQALLEETELHSNDGDVSEDGWGQLHPDGLLRLHQNGFY